MWRAVLQVDRAQWQSAFCEPMATDPVLAAIERRFDAVDVRFDRLERDLAPINAEHARDGAVREAALIAEDGGLTFIRILSDEEIRELVHSSDTAGVAKNELRSFRRADLTLEARDTAGELCYLAAEASMTVNRQDATRAIRNAELLARFTGRQAYATVAGLRHDDRIRDRIEAGGVAWYQLDARSGSRLTSVTARRPTCRSRCRR